MSHHKHEELAAVRAKPVTIKTTYQASAHITSTQHNINMANAELRRIARLRKKYESDLLATLRAAAQVTKNRARYTPESYAAYGKSVLARTDSLSGAVKNIDSAVVNIEKYKDVGAKTIKSLQEWVGEKDRGVVVDAYRMRADVTPLVPVTAYVPAPGDRYSITYKARGITKTVGFESKTEAERYLKTLAREAERTGEAEFTVAMVEALEVETVEKAKEKIKEYGEQQRDIRDARQQGLIIVEDDMVSLDRPVEVLTDKQIKLLKDIGFDIPDLPPGPSWAMYQWGEAAFKGGRDWRGREFSESTLEDFAKSQTEYYSALIGTGVKAMTGPYRWLIKLITGKNEPTSRAVTARTLKHLENITPAQQIYLHAGGTGAEFFGSYVGLLPLGVATSGVLSAAKTVAPKAVLSTAKIIASHPTLAKAMLLAPIVGYNAKEIWAMHQRGDPLTDVMGEMAMRGGAIIGGTAGFSKGFSLFSDVTSATTLKARRAKLAEYLKKNDPAAYKSYTLYQSRQRLVPPERIRPGAPAPTIPLLDTASIAKQFYRPDVTSARLSLWSAAHHPSVWKSTVETMLEGASAQTMAELWWLAYFPALWVDAIPETQLDLESSLAQVYGMTPTQVHEVLSIVENTTEGLLDYPIIAETQIPYIEPIVSPVITPITEAVQEQVPIQIPIVEPVTEQIQVAELVPIAAPPEVPPLGVEPAEVPVLLGPKIPKLVAELKPIPRTQKPQLYHVLFSYPTGASEKKKVNARSYPNAYNTANRIRRIKLVPLQVDIEKIPLRRLI